MPRTIPPTNKKVGTPPGNFVEWVYETWASNLNIPKIEGSRAFKRFLGKVQYLDMATIKYSGALRVQDFQIIKFGYPLRRAGYTVGVAKAKMGGAEGVVGYYYWPLEGGAPEYVCLSPTFDSCDGEYRHRFTWYEQFLAGYDNLEPMSQLEEVLLGLVRDGELELEFRAFPSERSDLAEDYARENRLTLKALAAIVSLDMADHGEGGPEIHTSPKHGALLRALAPNYVGAFPEGQEGVKYRNAAGVLETGGRAHRAQCGQKMVPLTLRGAAQVMDINYSPWREVWVGGLASDLVVNGVSPCFPLCGSWTYLGGGRDLFENPAMLARYATSERGRRTVEMLSEARTDGDGALAPLDTKIWEAAKFAQGYVVLSDLVLLSTGEYVGKTAGSMPGIIAKASTIADPVRRVFTEAGMQARYLFDLCFGALALHTRAGVVHSDLHTNNITINEQRWRTDTTKKPDPLIAYVASSRGEADTYVFVQDGIYATIIDFSRAILGPPARERIASELGEEFADTFYRAQASRVLRVFAHYVPAYTKKHQDRIKSLIASDFGEIFAVLAAVDFLAIGRNFGALYRKAAGLEIAIAPEGPAMAAKIEKLAFSALVGGLSRLVDDVRPRPPARPAGEDIVRKAFAPFRYTAKGRKKGVLAAVYNIEAPLRYSSTEYSNFPPWGRLDEIEKHLGGMKLEELASRDVRPFLQSRAPGELFEVLVEEAQGEIDPPPAGEGSSTRMAEF